MKKILLGFEAKTGAAVYVRRHHTVVTGSTQLSGKSTTLEALATRACADDPRTTVIAFVTKRGEGAMRGARPHEPFFRPRADWQYVQAILEATMRERLKFQRSWIIKASHGAKTLQDVRANVVKALADPRTRGLSEGVYTELKAFLDIVIPQLERHPFAGKLDLRAGLNVMDLTALTQEVQGLVIASTVEYLHREAKNCIVVVPEAWKFLPEGRKGPVQLAAEAYAREGAALGNYLWLDSQDIAGVDKAPLKMVDVWVLGRQREKNEVERTIAQLPVGKARRPKVEDVMRLPIGHFYACTEEDGVALVYVQPAWLPEKVAIAVAQGAMSIEEAAKHQPRAPLRAALKDLKRAVVAAPTKSQEEDPVYQEMYEQERAARAQLEKELAKVNAEVDRLLKKVTAVEQETRQAAAAARATAAKPPPAKATRAPQPSGTEPGTLLHLDVERPVLEVKVHRPVVRVGDDLRGRAALLIHDGFFDEPRGIGAVYREAQARGWGQWSKNGNARSHLVWLAQKGFLRVDGDNYVAVAGAVERVEVEETR